MEVVEGPVGAAHLPALLDLLEASGLPDAGISEHLDTTRVYRSPEGRIVASGALELYGELALLRSVAVAADHQGQGLGGRMTGALLDLAARLGVQEVFLLTETAQRFFERHGFAEVPRPRVPAAIRDTVEFSKACPESATVMRRPVGTGCP